MTIGGREWRATEAARLIGFARAARVPGGFAWLDDAGAPDRSRPLELWITARMTHVFALGHLLGHDGCDQLVDHGVHALEFDFQDRVHGGWCTSLDGDFDKRAYDHAFVVLAAASAVAAGHPDAGALLARALSVVEAHFWSDADGACVESWDRAWTTCENYRGANSNMHAVEAFLAAGDVTGEAVWHERALRIANRIVEATAGSRVLEHFGRDWTPWPEYNRAALTDPFRPFGATPGHGFEWARLLTHVGAALADPPRWLAVVADALFARALADGWDRERGGFVYTTDWRGRPIIRERFHWVHAEAIASAAVLGRDELLADLWAFADEHFVDHVQGGWRHELDAANQPSGVTWRGKPDTYHALQATLIPDAPPSPALAPWLASARLAGARRSIRGEP